MSVDAFITMRVGETRPLYVTITAETGTLTISGTPTVTLYDRTGAVAGSISGTSVTGSTSGASAAPQAFYNLATVSLTAGMYSLVFSITATATDGTTRIYKPELGIRLQAVP